MAMYSEILEKVGLSKNEAKIYEALLKYGESGVGAIANKTQIHRRNIYDSLARLLEKGLVFEVLESRENKYQAVEPYKMMEMVEEKRKSLLLVMPELEKLYQNKAPTESMYVYRGLEGWKNYMRDLARLGEDLYTIGGKGTWTDPLLNSSLQQIKQIQKKKKIKFNILFDNELKNNKTALEFFQGDEYRFLPKDFSTSSTIDIFADRVVILSDISVKNFNDKASFSVIINKQIADSFRTWFQALWGISRNNIDKTRYL